MSVVKFTSANKIEKSFVKLTAGYKRKLVEKMT
jgi:hypothetical protein